VPEKGGDFVVDASHPVERQIMLKDLAESRDVKMGDAAEQKWGRPVKGTTGKRFLQTAKV
jgi:hypothetical protein